jgi:hypothetical protein
MSKNKFRALLFLLIISGGAPSINLHSDASEGIINTILLGTDIVVNLLILVSYIYVFAWAIIYGVRAYMEDEPSKKLTKL